jgi:hypothetical protein
MLFGCSAHCAGAAGSRYLPGSGFVNDREITGQIYVLVSKPSLLYQFTSRG